MLIYNYQKEFVGIDKADLEVFGFANLAELKAEASDFADMFVRTPGYIHNFKHVHWIDFVTCAEPSDESKVVIEVNSQTFKANLEIETVYLSDNPTSKAYLVHLNSLRGLTVKENGDISEDIARQRPKRVEPTVGFAFNAPQEDEEFDSPAVMQEIPELEGFKPFEHIDEVEEVADVQSDTALDVHFDDDTLDESTPVTTDTPKAEVVEEQNIPIDIEDAYTIDDIALDVHQEEAPSQVINEVEAEDDDFDYSYNYDPQVASDELGLPIDLIEEFIEDFIAQSNEFREELYNSLHDGDLDNVKVLSHKLKGVAANLRIEDAFNTLSIINTSSDITEVESHLNIFYKIIAKLSGEEVQTPTVTKTEPEEAVEEEPQEDANDLYQDDLEIGFKEPEDEASIEIEEKIEESLEDSEVDNILEEMEISIQEDEEQEIDIAVEDSEVPHKIEMPELADDEFLNNTLEETPEEEVDIDNLLSMDTQEEDFTSKEEILDIQESFEIEEEFEITPDATPSEIEYSKEIVASEIGLDKESFDEIFEDYIIDSLSAIKEINEAISENDFYQCKKEALKLKGMSDNMRVNAFNDELNSLINSSDTNELTNAITKIGATIAQISK